MQSHINILGAHVNSTSPAAQQTFQGLQQVFTSRGADAITSAHQASAAVWGMVLQQASMLSYNDVFRFLGGMFLLLLPLLFLMKKPKAGKGPAMAH